MLKIMKNKKEKKNETEKIVKNEIMKKKEKKERQSVFYPNNVKTTIFRSYFTEKVDTA